MSYPVSARGEGYQGLNQSASTPSLWRYGSRDRTPARSPIPSPFASAKLRTYTWYTTASRHHGRSASATAPTVGMASGSGGEEVDAVAFDSAGFMAAPASHNRQ